MRICVMSDLHGELPTPYEAAELTLICGDIVPLRMQRNIPQSRKWIFYDFVYWALNWPGEKILFIGGNHDFIFDGHWHGGDTTELYIKTNGKLEYMPGDFPKYYTNFSGQEYKIYGTPYCHIFGEWAFMREDETLRELYKNIPTECDVIISHDAADINNLGLVPPNIWHSEPENAGNKILAEAIQLAKPRFYFCGHIHEGNHQVTEIDGTTMANVSLLNDKYQMVYEPLYIDI